MRLLPLLLALVFALGGADVLAGIAEPASCAEPCGSEAGCIDGCDDERDDCADCTTCSGCPCCPPRTGTTSPRLSSFSPHGVETRSLLTPLAEPVLSGSGADIFHPPRA